MPAPGTTLFIAASMSAWFVWPAARRVASACWTVTPAGICLPTTPSKMTFVALPRILGPRIAKKTLTTARTRTNRTIMRSGRSSRRSRRNEPLKSFDLAAGACGPPIMPGPPMGRRGSGGGGRRAGTAGWLPTARIGREPPVLLLVGFTSLVPFPLFPLLPFGWSEVGPLMPTSSSVTCD